MKILVTGGSGQLASEIKFLSSSNNNDFLFVNSQECDITKLDKLDEILVSNKIDFIINCAAYTAVDNAEDDVERAYAVNEIGVKNIDMLAIKYHIRYIHISTDYVFDGMATSPYMVTSPTNPIGVYGNSKRKGEEIIINSTSESIIIRTSWLYSSYASNFVKTMLRIGKDRNELNVVGDQFGSPTYARDLATAIIQIIDSNKRFSSEKVYHFSNTGITNWSAFASSIFKLAAINCQVNSITTEEYPTKAKRPAYSVLDASKIINDFNISIRSWEDALSDCILAIEKGNL